MHKQIDIEILFLPMHMEDGREGRFMKALEASAAEARPPLLAAA